MGTPESISWMVVRDGSKRVLMPLSIGCISMIGPSNRWLTNYNLISRIHRLEIGMIPALNVLPTTTMTSSTCNRDNAYREVDVCGRPS